ncbi:MAG: hypothetical protein NU471_01090 [Candidatus Carsonella ruddii]|nr:MAG: hypothetical protein NU471_01090 [Candidatus Carsonella ruddii]
MFNYFKYFKIGTNSKNCFLKQKYNYYFYSIIINNYLRIYNIKIFQNKLNIFLTKIVSNYKNNILYKKINGFMIFFSKKMICSKLSFLISIFKKKEKKKRIFFKIFLIKNKNYISKFFYFLKKKKLLSNIFSHNDIFKDNILILGNFISSLIDLNNYSFLKSNNDLSNLILEFTENLYFKKNIIVENFFKKKKNVFFNINYYILKTLIYRKKKLNLIRKTKNPNNYIKKNIFNEKF